MGDNNKLQNANNKTQTNMVVKQQTLTDFEGLNTLLSRWQYDMRQVESGPFSGTLTQFGNDQLHFFHLSKNRVVEHRATTPKGMLNFIFLGTDSSQICISKQKLDEYCMVMLQPGTEFKGISHPDLSMFAVSVDKDLLEKYASLQGLQLPLALTGQTTLSVLPTYLRDLEIRITRLFEVMADPLHSMQNESSVHKMKQELVSTLLLSISPKQQQDLPVASSCRILEKAIDYINPRLMNRVSIQELCNAFEVSERTLQYAFKEHFGVSPVNYIRAIRLNKVYKALRNSDQSVMISEIARSWGFNHMSQFTADYKKHFGELPSDTLAK